MKKENYNKIHDVIIILFSIWCGLGWILFGSQSADGVTSSNYPRITVTGNLYGYDDTPITSGVAIRLVVGPNNLATNRHIQIGYGEVSGGNGEFTIASWDWDEFYGKFDGDTTDLYTQEEVNAYDPSTYHVYVTFNLDDKILLKNSQGQYVKQHRPDRIDLGVVTGNKTFDLGNVSFRQPNVVGSILEDNGIYKAETRMFITPVGEFPTYDDQVLSNSLGYWSYREPGEYTIHLYDEYDTWGNRMPAISEDNLLRSFNVTVGSNGIASADFYVNENHTDEEGYIEVPSDDNVSDSISTLLSGIDTTKTSKDTVGLNVHLALDGGASFDALMINKLEASHTKWVREQFDFSVDPVNTHWADRYETIRNYYRGIDINIIGMLSGLAEDMPSITAWKTFVADVVSQHKDYIKVWELWNEPDLNKFLDPNTVSNYIPYLQAGYEAVKSVDPNALVLNAPVSWPNASFVEGLYQQGSSYFDELALHVYYCDQYKADGNLGDLQRDFANVLAVKNKYRPSDKIWITELGCSTYGEYSETFQEQYLSAVVPYLLSTGQVEKVLLFNVINRTTTDPYEDNFGLLNRDFTAKPAWNWYKTFSASSTEATPVASGTSFFAYDSRLRGGYQIASGNVRGDDKAEIISGTGDGMGPHVQVFDSQGNRLAQFFAYDQSLRNGVTVSACDVNGDGYDEIVTAQGKGGWPLVKIFDGYGNVINEGFNVLDGMYTGGVNLSCGDTDGDGTSEIVVAARQGGGPHVLVYNQDGRILTNFMAYDPNFRGGINVTTIDMDGDGRDEIVTGPQYGAPHVQIFQIRPNELKRLSPGFYAFDPGYRGGVQVAGLDLDGDGTKELMVGVGENAQPLVKRYNIREQLQGQFYAFGTNYLGGVMVAGGDVDNDGQDEILVMPRSGGGPNVRIIEGDNT